MQEKIWSYQSSLRWLVDTPVDMVCKFLIKLNTHPPYNSHSTYRDLPKRN